MMVVGLHSQAQTCALKRQRSDSEEAVQDGLAETIASYCTMPSCGGGRRCWGPHTGGTPLATRPAALDSQAEKSL